MNCKKLILTAMLLVISGCNDISGDVADQNATEEKHQENLFASSGSTTHQDTDYDLDPSYSVSFAGNYLAGKAAQQNNDWERASGYFKKASIYFNSPDNKENNTLKLKERAMILAYGSGQYDNALEIAKDIYDEGGRSTSGLLILATTLMKNGQYEEAYDKLLEIDTDNSANAFLLPLLKSWAMAGMGQLHLEDLQVEKIHLYHAILISQYMGNYEAIDALIGNKKIDNVIPAMYLERVGDLLYTAGDKEKALEAYQSASNIFSDDNSLMEKVLFILNNEENKNFKIEPPKPLTIDQGVALAFLDMSQILADRYEYDIAKVFFHFALFMDPDCDQAKISIGVIDASYEQYDKAIEQLSEINEESSFYVETSKKLATLLTLNGEYDKAIKTLEKIYHQYNDIEALMLIVDVYNEKEDFEKTLETADIALKSLDPNDTESLWRMQFSKGIALERLGKWQDAEDALQKALIIQPNEPHILNYLGYTWADNGVKLEQAYDLIERAIDLEPDDPHIMDSMGWILFRLGKYKEALEYLEVAAEYLPSESIINEHLGDVYWMSGRRLEAKYQWQRAVEFSDDPKVKKAIAEKIKKGLVVSKQASVGKVKSANPEDNEETRYNQ